ncbi:uncharacterized protein LOC132715967 [Ruditapes philippinarum]|uniref:uncharacterized protein LOC132715967 n=1 Tax=Ruditapes philippinarum TaxID=129788 RepID=UPI00295B6F56|nr:uncharacterized protein LOC132715967 [Ruditapes philippinarum]
MEVELCACVLLNLLVSCIAWPRYGRPHPLYNGRLQTNENIFANAVLLGLDFNDLQSLQAASGNVFGLGNLGLPNNGFPMNAYERKRARQDVNTLTALGVIDGPEEAGPYGSLAQSNRPDPPDNPRGRDGGGGNKTKTGKKSKSTQKNTGKVSAKSKQVVKNTHVQTIADSSANSGLINTQPMIQDTKSNTRITGRQGVVLKGQVNEIKSIDTAGKPAQAIKTTVPKQKLATELVKVMRQTHKTGTDKRNNRKVGAASVRRPKKRKTKRKGGNVGEWGDAGEGRLSERGDIPLKGRGKQVVWRSSGGEDAQIGRGEVLDRRVFVGRF